MRDLGDKGEELAVKHLKKKGYRILVRNYKAPTGEIDIIADDRGKLVFVEVKTRTDDLFGQPEEAVNLKKQNRIKKTALHYMSRLKKERPARFDIVSVHVRDKTGKINHIEDAFEVYW
jgi:putative endonuclease